MPTRTTGPILVLGGTGKTGRRIADRLAELGVPFRVGSRHGLSAAYVSSYPDLAVPGAPEAVER